MTCKFEYNKKQYSEGDIKPIISYHYLVEDHLLNESDNTIIKKKNRLEIDEDRRETAEEVIQKTNSDYGLGSKIVELNEDSGIVSIDVNPIANSILSYQEDIVPEVNDTTEYIRKTEDLDDVDSETLESFNAKASLMEERFSEVGIPSHIILDGDLQSSGVLLGTDTQEYKDMLSTGEISEGNAVIKVNPTDIYKETILHEYGHMFVNMLGGMNNPRIKYAYAKVRDTAIAQDVRNTYTGLTEEELQEEIIVTLIGKEASELFEQGDTRNFIQKFIDWFRKSIGDIFGISTDTVKTLSQEMLGFDGKTLDGTKRLSGTSKAFKGTKEAREERSKNQRKIEGAKDSLEVIKNRINNTIVSIGKSEDPQKKELKAKLKLISNDIESLSATSNILAISSFIENFSETANDIYEYLLDLNNKINEGEQISISFAMLNQIETMDSLLSVLDDLENNITSGFFNKEFKDQGWTEEDKEEFLSNVESLIIKHDKIQDLHITVGRHHIAEKLAKYSNRVIITRRTELEREFKSIYKQKEGETDKQYQERRKDYINEHIVEELPELKKQEKEWILERLESSPADIHGFGALVSSEKDLNSMVVQMASKLLDESDLKRDQKMLEKKIQSFEVFKKFDAETSGTDPKNKYKGLYTEGSDDRLYITGEYNIEWYIQRNKLESTYLNLKDTLGSDHEDTKKAQNSLYTWQRKNMINIGESTTPSYIPTDRWKNKEYSQIMSNPTSGKAVMLKYLIDTSLENHKMLHGNNSLVKNTSQSNTTFILAPSIGRSTFEKAVSGNIIDNTKDWFERLYKAKTDDEDLIGQVEEDPLNKEKQALRVMQDSRGNLRHGVPIHFRGKMSTKDVSYDLMSSVMIDSYMATNYLYKSGLQIELELMKDITANKKITQTSGFAKKTFLNAFDKTGKTKVDPLKGINSNEYKVLNSIIENRLYGIKNINTEYAKLTSTLMSWSASTMLMFNLPSGMVNLLQGKVFNFIEAIGGEFYNTKDLKKGEGMFFKDMRYWMDDIGKPIHTSKTNQLLELLNVQGEFKAISSKFLENNRFKALANKNTAFAFNHIGEMYMHSTLMYSVLNSIKIFNGKNQYIDSNGKVVTDPNKAMTLAEAITVDPKTNQLQLNKHVYKTSFGNSGFSFNTKDKGLLEVRALINKLAHDMHGNYNEEIQNMAQRHMFGKMAFMLRKWMIPGFNRRWRGFVHATTPTDKLQDEVDNFYSEDLQAFQEGYYTTAARLGVNIARDLKQLQFEAFSKNWNELSDRELANMRRFLIEASVMLLTLAASYILRGLAKDIEDPVEREVMFHLTYYTRRMFSELNFYSNPIEAFKIMSTPAASMAYVAKLGKFASQVVSDTSGIVTGEGPEYYERGPYTDRMKLWKRTIDITPGLNQYHRNIEESTGWLFNVY